MALTPEQVGLLLKMLQDTQDVELTCPECLADLDKYAQSNLDGLPLDGVLARLREHLEACPGCNEEFQLILETLDAMEET
jgi:hypothetical protein